MFNSLMYRCGCRSMGFECVSLLLQVKFHAPQPSIVVHTPDAWQSFIHVLINYIMTALKMVSPPLFYQLLSRQVESRDRGANSHTSP